MARYPYATPSWMAFGSQYDPNKIVQEKLRASRESFLAKAAGTPETATASVPQVGDLMADYRTKINIDTDPTKIYEGMMAPARGDLSRAQSDIALGMQKYAGRGSSYEDMLARYLPGATKQLADVASQASVESEKFAQAGQVAREQLASSMAQVDATLREQRYQFVENLKNQMAMLEKELEAKERIAMAQARSAEHAAQIQANASVERQRLASQAEMEIQRFSQQQQNLRHQMTMQVYDQHYGRQDVTAATQVAAPYAGIVNQPTTSSAGGVPNYINTATQVGGATYGPLTVNEMGTAAPGLQQRLTEALSKYIP